VKNDYLWNDQHEVAFQELKERMLFGPILSIYDSSKPLFVIADGSLEAIGYVIFQHGENKQCHLIGCGGRSLTIPGRKRYITDSECMGLVFAISQNHSLLAK